MASSPVAEEIGGLDLNAGEQEPGSAEAGAGPASDPGGDGKGECLVDSRDGDSTPREAGDALCGDHDARMDVAEEGSVADADGVSGAADIGSGSELQEEKQKDVDNEGVNSCLVDGYEGDQKLERDVAETESMVEIAIEAAVTEEIETVPHSIEPAEFGKTSNEDESIEKFESSSMEKPNLENDVMDGNLVEGGFAATENEAAQSHLVAPDESGGQGKAQMDVMETENVIGAAKTMDDVDPDEAGVVEAHFSDNKANAGGEKDNRVENENRAELVEEDLSHKTEEKSAVNHKMGCDSVDGHLQDKLDVMDSASSGMEDGSICTHKPKVCTVDAECLVENAATLATVAIEGDEVERLVDKSDPGSMQVEVSEIRDQTEIKEIHLSYEDGNKIFDGQLQPEEGASGSTVYKAEKKSCDDEKLEAVFINAGCPSGRGSSMNLVGMKAEKLAGVADQGDVDDEFVEISDRSEPPGEGISCADTASQVTNDELVDRNLEATEVDLGSNALDAGCTIRAAEADPLVAFVSVEAGNLEGTHNLGRAQVKDTENGNETRLPGHGLSTAEENPSLPNEVVDHAVVDGHLHATGVLRPGHTDQNEALVLESSLLIGEMEDVLTLRFKQEKESRELDGETEVGELSMQESDRDRASVSEMPFGDTSQNVQDEDNAVHQKELQKVDPLLVDGTAIDEVNNDKRDSDSSYPIDPVHEYHLDIDIMVTAESDTTTDVKVVKPDSGDIHSFSDNQETESQTVMDSLNLSVEGSMPRISESSQTENVFSGTESADILNKNQEIESQTVSSVADKSHLANAIGANSFAGRDQNMVMEYKVHEDDEFPTTEFFQISEIGAKSEADQKNLVLRGGIMSVSLDADTSDDQEMVVDEQETSRGTDKQTVRHVATRSGISVKDTDQRACYYLPSKDEDGFSTSDLIWGKVKSHPWWPGQIFDPSDASDLALKYQKKDNFLVAYFGDKTFAWCDETQLKHFEIYFSLMEKQSNSDVFVCAVDGALDEVSRRMGLGMTCFCFPEAANANFICQKVENAGIHKGCNGYTVDRSAILSYFQPGKLLEYVRALAKFPDGGTDRLELVIANSQLKAFYRSKGYPELPSFQFVDGFSESDAELPLSVSEGSGEDTIEQSGPTLSDLIRGRGSSINKQKHVSEDGKKQKSLSELMEAKGSQLANGAKTESGINADIELVSFSSSKKRKATDSDSDSGKSKRKSLDSLGDLEIKLPSPTISSSFKVGECIRRVASQLTGSLPILKNLRETSLKNVFKDDSIFDVFVSDGICDNNMQSPKTVNLENYSSPEEMLSQLCLAASDPMEGYSFLSVIISFFTEFRNYCVSSSSSEKKHPEKAGGKRGRKRKVDIRSDFSETTEPDHMQDSYWSDLISHDSPAKSKGEARTRSQRKKRKSSGQTSSTLILVPVLQGTDHRHVGIISPNMKQAPLTDKPIISVEEKMVDERTPTALILNFNGSKSLPSKTDLVRIFSRYGPLKEAETEVQRKNNHVKVVFKRRADAEIAFSSAGKYSIFGPSLLSYRLKYLPSTPDTSPDANQLDKMDALVESNNLDIPDNLHSSMSSVPDTNLQGKSNIVFIVSSNTDIPIDLDPSMSNASPDTDLQDTSDAVLTENSNTNIPSKLHPSMSDASLDTNLLEQNDAMLIESSNSNLPCNLHPPTSDAFPYTNLQDKGDVVLTEKNSIHNHLHQSMIDASLDTNLQDKSNAVLVESSNTCFPGDLHPSMGNASPDTNRQDKSDVVLTESSNTNIPSDLHLSTPDASPDTDLQDKVDIVLIGSSNTNIPANRHVSIVDASLDTKPEDKNDTTLREGSNMDISAQADTEIVLDAMEVVSEKLVARAAEVDEEAGHL